MSTSSALPAHPAPGPSASHGEVVGPGSALAAAVRPDPGAAAITGGARPAEEQLERLTGLAARVTAAPAALLVLLDERRAIRTVAWGLSEPLYQARDIAAVALCRAALTEASPSRPLAVADSAADPGGAAELRALGVAAHAVVPLRLGGRAAGALCALDTRPRAWTPDQLAGLRDMAAALEHELTLRVAVRAAGDEQRRVEAVLASISDAFFAIDRHWRFSYVNDRAEQLLQRTRASLLGCALWEEFPAANGSLFEREYRRAMATGEPVAFEAHYPPPLDAWYEVRAYPGREGLAVYFQNITERRRAVDALAESEARFRAVQDASPDGSIVMRAVRDAAGTIVDFRFTYANAAAGRILLDCEDEAIVGRTMTEAFPDSVEAGRLEIYRRVAETGEPWLQELFFVRGGADRGLRVSAVRIEDGVHLGFADLSERIGADAERERLLQALQAQRGLTDAVNAQRPVGLVVVDVPSGR
jgi:PAS domain-containing protein